MPKLSSAALLAISALELGYLSSAFSPSAFNPSALGTRGSGFHGLTRSCAAPQLLRAPVPHLFKAERPARLCLQMGHNHLDRLKDFKGVKHLERSSP
mmetsp:Transcript_32172/g.50207  ORF Transcript_32172/g.50207 Transcript_32172/m.50207 type:complete len:97 (+) Transcript_32172:378-668(+)